MKMLTHCPILIRQNSAVRRGTLTAAVNSTLKASRTDNDHFSEIDLEGETLLTGTVLAKACNARVLSMEILAS